MDNIENLYIGRIDKLIARINGTDEALFEGEVLLYGQALDGVFVVEEIRRLALYGSLVDAGEDERLGLISFAGPLDKVELEPDSSGTVDLRQQIHYHELSNEEVNPLYKDDEVEFPWVETLAVSLNWEWIDDRDPTAPELRFNISLPSSELIPDSVRLGRISSLTFEVPQEVMLYQARSNAIGNLGICPFPKNPPCPDDPELFTLVRQWPLRFINVSGIPNGDLLADVDNQITAICNTWWQKAALNLTEQPQIEDGTAFLAANPGYIEIDSTRAKALATLYNLSKNGTLTTPPYHVEVYLVNEIQGQVASHGGVARNNGQASAYCILQADKLGPNHFLLGHELGHALGLNDLAAGAPQSIMIPRTPNFSTITLDDCQIVTSWGADPAIPATIPIHPIPGDPPIPLNAIVRAVPGSFDCLRPG